jgi:Uma2 family endonuclease
LAARVSVTDYLRGPETLKPMELVYGVVREPPAPRYGHQSIVTRTGYLLYHHVRELKLGEVCVSPVDVVLDRKEALVVQPDVIFVSKARLEIIRDCVWGPPDLVVEVLSPRTAARDRREKLAWYRRYGVRECWFMDPRKRRMEVVVGAALGASGSRAYTGDTALRFTVLTALTLTASAFFE